METLRTSSYIIPVKLESEEGKYMLIHGYTGAMDIVSESVVLCLKYNEIKKLSDLTLQALQRRGYITNKTKEEEIEYVERVAQALHKRDEILHKSFTWVVTYNCNFRCPYCFEKREYKDSPHRIVLTKSQVDRLFNAMIEIEPRKQLQDSVITLYGGEPLLKENKEIVTYIVQEGRKKGYRFSTYATWWIRQSITRAIADQARTIRIPVHMVEVINRVMRSSRRMLQELGREPTTQEIAERLHMTSKKVEEVLNMAQEPVSLETPVGEEEDSHLVDFIQDEKMSFLQDEASFVFLHEQLMEVLKTLTPREQQVLSLRFGLYDGQPRTLEEVGKQFHVTRERIRQIEDKALRKLRHPSRSRKLKDYLES